MKIIIIISRELTTICCTIVLSDCFEITAAFFLNNNNLISITHSISYSYLAIYCTFHCPQNLHCFFNQSVSLVQDIKADKTTIHSLFSFMDTKDSSVIPRGPVRINSN
jgi:hypothetical protein